MNLEIEIKGLPTEDVLRALADQVDVPDGEGDFGVLSARVPLADWFRS